MQRIRNSNIELLRIFSMLLIVAGHFAGQGGLKENAEGVSKILIYVFGSGQRVAVNIFLIISVWFLVDLEFRAKHLLKIWLEVLFYTVIITITLKILGGSVSSKELIQAFMPFLGRPLWFASAYLALLMISPYLKKTVELTRKQHCCLVIVLGLVTCILPTLASEMDTYLCAIIWFCFVYVLIGYYKHYMHPNKMRGSICLIVGVVLYIVIAAFVAFQFESELLQITQELCERFLHDFKSIPNVLIAFLLFTGFLKMKPRYSKTINEIAAGSFAVYIIHQTPAFYPILWSAITNTGQLEGARLIPMFILAVVLIYLVFSTIDIFRRKVIEPMVIKAKIVKKFENTIEGFYGLKDE